MAPKKRGYRVGKTTVVDLLDSQAGIGSENIACAQETSAFLMCLGTHMISPDDPYPSEECFAEEMALTKCEMKMGNNTTKKLKADMKKSLVFNMLRLSNFTKKIK